ncbi:MAG: hypothetical protein JWO52_228 [Gammaproteobacteria bacterium]|nr:hypothetical protein [Gammaproteobacteria bacterium]
MSPSTSIVGDLDLRDELMHPVTDEPAFNESMMFNFFDNSQLIGGFMRIGNRPNEGHAEMTFCLFLRDGELLMQWGRPAIGSNEEFAAAGLRFNVLEPGRRLQVRFQGSAVRIDDPYTMKNPGKALRENPTVAVDLALDIFNTGPMIGSASGDPRGAVIFLDGVGHYQQPIGARGRLSVAEDHWNLEMLGARDHSWGRRVWSSIHRDRSIWVTFGPDLAVICCKTWLEPEPPPDVMGCIVEGGRVTALRRVEMQSRFKLDTHYHESVRVQIEDVEGRALELVGEVLAYVPLRHRFPGKETVFLGQAITRFTANGRSALGLSEYFDAESACPALVQLSRERRAARE